MFAFRLGERRNTQHRPDDRLDPCLGAGHGKFKRPEQIPGIGDRHGRHVVTRTEINELTYDDGALRQRVRRVYPQMNEIRVRHDPYALLDVTSSHTQLNGIRRTKCEL